MQKVPTSGGGHHCMTRTPLQAGPMLVINSPISHKQVASPLPRARLFSTPRTHICDTIFQCSYLKVQHKTKASLKSTSPKWYIIKQYRHETIQLHNDSIKISTSSKTKLSQYGTVTKKIQLLRETILEQQSSANLLKTASKFLFRLTGL
jgi:hypothetical protein